MAHGIKVGISALALMLASCGDVSYSQKESPANIYKDYRQEAAAVVGVGDPISKRQMRANATMKINGHYSLSDVMNRLSKTYNMAIRWEDGVRKERSADILISELTFDEARNYVEDVYNVQIVREGGRRLAVMSAIGEPRIEDFSPSSSVALSDVVRGFARQCGFNVVITENKDILANTLITTSLKNVNCMDAFDAVLTPHGLSLVDEGEHFSIGGYPQRQWVLNLFEPNREETQTISYESESSGESEDGANSSSGGAGTTQITSTRDLWAELESDLSQLVEKSCENAERNAQSTLAPSTFLPPPSTGGETTPTQSTVNTSTRNSGSFECGYVRVNRAVGMVQMRAPRKVLEQAEEIISRVQDIASRRLLVEARIIAVTRERGFDQGGNLLTGQNTTHGKLGGGWRGNNTQIDLTETGTIAGAILDLVDSGGNRAGNGYFGFAGKNLDAAVQVAENFGTTYQLMQPTIEVMDRQRSVLIDGRNERYFICESTRDADTGETTIDVEERTQFVGIQFAVSAQIAEDGEPHTVSVQVPMTEIAGTVPVPNSNCGTNVPDAPIVTSRIIDQKVRIRDGEVKVIGGLTRTLAIDRESGVPLIRGIPMAGKFFNEEDIEYTNVEFLVLLQVQRLY